MKIYVASSWSNERQDEIVRRLRGAGHEVYDFRGPGLGFNGSDIDPDWRRWCSYVCRDSNKRNWRG